MFSRAYAKCFSQILGAGLLGLCLTVASADARSSAEVCPSQLRFADTGIEGMEEMSRAFGEFASELKAVTGVDIVFFPVSDRTAAVNALQFDQVDIILAGPSEYAIMKSRQPIQIMFGIERHEYGTAFVVHEDNPAQTLADIRGMKVALKDPGSTTGHIIPSWMMVQAGLDLDRDVEIIMADSARFEVLISRDVDVMGSGVRDVERLRQRDPQGRYRVIAESETMPRDVFVARGGLDAACVAAVSEAVEANAERLMNAIVNPGERDKYLQSHFVFDVTDEEFDVVREAYALVGMPLY